MNRYISYADCYLCQGSGWVGEGPGGCQSQCPDCATRRTHEASRKREQKLRDRIAELEVARDALMLSANKQADRIHDLESALRELLQDTQHVGHSCGDSADYCPVLNAKLVLERNSLMDGCHE